MEAPSWLTRGGDNSIGFRGQLSPEVQMAERFDLLLARAYDWLFVFVPRVSEMRSYADAA
jgi:hypothetical protein